MCLCLGLTTWDRISWGSSLEKNDSFALSGQQLPAALLLGVKPCGMLIPQFHIATLFHFSLPSFGLGRDVNPSRWSLRKGLLGYVLKISLSVYIRALVTAIPNRCLLVYIKVWSSALFLPEFLFPVPPQVTLSNMLSVSGVELEVIQSEFPWTNSWLGLEQETEDKLPPLFWLINPKV